MILLKSIDVNNIEVLCEYSCNNLIEYEQIKIDSRAVKRGDIFAGIKGSKVDGNRFAQEAISRGAVAVILDDINYYKPVESNKVLVKDSSEALLSIGKKRLESFKGYKIAITGSAGKTTMKEMIHMLLSSKYDVFKTYNNNNNELGIALNCSNLSLDESFGIFEFGTNNIGEIANLSGYVNPHTCIITNVGTSHIGRFGSLEALLNEKLSIIKSNNIKDLWLPHSLYKQIHHLLKGNFHIKTFSGRDESYISVQDLELSGDGLEYLVKYDGHFYKFRLNHFYEHLAYNTLVPIGIAFECGLTYDEIHKVIESFKPMEGRGNIIKSSDLYIINDVYNASLEAILSAINSFNKLAVDRKKVAVIGHMAEIEGFEEKLYKRIYEKACRCSDISFIFVGYNYKKFPPANNIEITYSKEEALNKIKYIRDAYVLIKAARVNAFEDIVNELINSQRANNAL